MTCFEQLAHGQYLMIPFTIGIAVAGSFSTYCTTQYESCWWYLLDEKRSAPRERGDGDVSTPAPAGASSLTPLQYLEKHSIAPLLNTAVNELGKAQPADPVPWLAKWLADKGKQ